VRPRLAALVVAGTVVFTIAGCGRYGPPKRIPKATLAAEPAPEDERPAEPTAVIESNEATEPAE